MCKVSLEQVYKKNPRVLKEGKIELLEDDVDCLEEISIVKKDTSPKEHEKPLNCQN